MDDDAVKIILLPSALKEDIPVRLVTLARRLQRALDAQKGRNG
ncbi:hypothetical protein [Methylobrevis pamukkalensis]|nr:hypothetical protein [Methylobrevis pamukkalensis]